MKNLATVSIVIVLFLLVGLLVAFIFIVYRPFFYESTPPLPVEQPPVPCTYSFIRDCTPAQFNSYCSVTTLDGHIKTFGDSDAHTLSDCQEFCKTTTDCLYAPTCLTYQPHCLSDDCDSLTLQDCAIDEIKIICSNDGAPETCKNICKDVFYTCDSLKFTERSIYDYFCPKYYDC